MTTTTKIPRSGTSPWLRVGLAIVAVVGLYAAGRMLGAMLRGGGAATPAPPQLFGSIGTIVAVVLAMFGVLLVHELGHLVGGRLAGFRPVLLVLGPFRLERERARWRVRWNRDLALAGGLAGALPTGESDPVRLRRATALMVAGGPLASLLLGVSTLLVGTLLFRGAPGLASLIPVAIGVASIAIGGITLVPGRTAGYLTDGARLWLLYKGGPAADRDVALQALFGASQSGVRPRDWSVDLLARARSLEDGASLEVAAWQLSQMHAADSGSETEARQWLERVLAHLDRLPNAAQPGTRFDAARQLAMWGDLDRARALMAQGGDAIGAAFLKPAAELAILVAQGQMQEAGAMLPRVRQLVAASSDAGGAAWLGSDLDRLAARIADGGMMSPIRGQ